MAERAWERSERKFFVLIMRAEGLPMRGDHEPDTFCKLHLGKEKMRTSIVKRTVSPLWEEFFVFELDSDTPMGDFRVEVREEKTFGTDCIGAWSLASPGTQLAADEPHEKFVDLVARPGKKDNGGGRLLLRMLYSSDVERRTESQALQADAGLVFGYEEYAGSFKTGDLIAYAEPGVVAASLKLWSGITYNRLGLVLALPNRWTERFELYVWEFTRNLDALVDAFTDTKRSGCALFRLFDRLHQCHASHIAWVALRTPLDRFSGQRLVEHAWAQHTGAQPATPADVDPEAQLMRFMHKLGIPARRAPPPELHAVHHLSMALRAAGLVPPDAPPPPAGLTTTKHILALPAYLPPRLIRSRSAIAPAPSSPSSSPSVSPVPAPHAPSSSPAATVLPVYIAPSTPRHVTSAAAVVPPSPRPVSTYSYAPSGPPPAYAPPQLGSPRLTSPSPHVASPAPPATSAAHTGNGNYNINVPPPACTISPYNTRYQQAPPYSAPAHPLQPASPPYADSFVPIRVDHGPPPVYSAPPPPPSMLDQTFEHSGEPPRPSMAHSLGEYALADYLHDVPAASPRPPGKYY